MYPLLYTNHLLSYRYQPRIASVWTTLAGPTRTANISNSGDVTTLVSSFSGLFDLTSQVSYITLPPNVKFHPKLYPSFPGNNQFWMYRTDRRVMGLLYVFDTDGLTPGSHVTLVWINHRSDRQFFDYNVQVSYKELPQEIRPSTHMNESDGRPDCVWQIKNG